MKNMTTNRPCWYLMVPLMMVSLDGRHTRCQLHRPSQLDHPEITYTTCISILVTYRSYKLIPNKALILIWQMIVETPEIIKLQSDRRTHRNKNNGTKQDRSH